MLDRNPTALSSPAPRPIAELEARAVIAGIGVHIPEPTITNREIVDSFNAYVAKENAHRQLSGAPLLEPSDPDFIEHASGIKARHVIEKTGVLDPDRMVPDIPDRADETLSVQAEFAVKSARRALAAADADPASVDLVICAAAQHQRPYPAIAIEVQRELGCGGGGFDMNVACSSTTFALHIGTNMIASGAARRVLVTCPEIMSGHLNFRDRATHFIFGDASASILLEAADTSVPARRSNGFNGNGKASGHWSIVRSDIWTEFSSNIRSNFGFLNRADSSTQFEADKLVTQVGHKVFKEVTIATERFVTDFLSEAGVTADDLSRLWLHQANLKMDDLVATKILGRNFERSEVPIVLDKYGNTAAPGSLIAFHETNDDLPSGSLGLICSFGAGYSIGALLVRKD
ncbi:MAG: beta-ketoacyl-ACP synthase III [Pseudomonadota bacterium]